MNKQKYFTTITILIAIISIFLLSLNHISNFPTDDSKVNIDGIEYSRGERIKFEESIDFKINGNSYLIEENTEIIFKSLDAELQNWQLLVGKIEINGEHIISIRDLILENNGQVIMTHFSWQNELQIEQIVGKTIIYKNNEELFLIEAGQKLTVNTFSPNEFSLENQE